MALEITHEWDEVITRFDHPRCEMSGSGAVFDVEEAVRAYFAESGTPFPDHGNEIIAITHADETVLVEFRLTGTHLGPLKVGRQVIEPTGKSFEVRMAASVEFKPGSDRLGSDRPGSDRIVCERPYLDQGMLVRALGLE